MKINYIALHQLIKEKNKKPSLKLSKAVIPINETSKEFFERVVKSYSSKNPTYGIFENNAVTFPFQTLVKTYLSDNDFLKFTSDSMEILKKEIDIPTTTGGYVVFIHYQYNKVDYLITLMLDNSTQFSVDDVKLTIKKLKSLDIEKMARANRININKWQNNEEQYLSFIKGTRHISIYFQRFIGSTDLTSSKQNTEKLKIAMQRYMRDNEYTEEQEREVYHRVKKYSLQKVNLDEDIEVKAISVLINEMNPDDFLNYIESNEELLVSGVFRVTTKTHLNFLSRVLVKEKGYSLDFNRELLNKKIFREGSNIIIKNVPADILKEF